MPPSSQDGTTSTSIVPEPGERMQDLAVEPEEAGQRESVWREPQPAEVIGSSPHQEIGLKELPAIGSTRLPEVDWKEVREAAAKMRGSPFTASPATITRLPDRWEYAEHTLPRANWIAEANAHGAEGWEMLSVEFAVHIDQHETTREVRHNQVVKCIFKRRLA